MRWPGQRLAVGRQVAAAGSGPEAGRGLSLRPACRGSARGGLGRRVTAGRRVSLAGPVRARVLLGAGLVGVGLLGMGGRAGWAGRAGWVRRAGWVGSRRRSRRTPAAAGGRPAGALAVPRARCRGRRLCFVPPGVRRGQLSRRLLVGPPSCADLVGAGLVGAGLVATHVRCGFVLRQPHPPARLSRRRPRHPATPIIPGLRRRPAVTARFGVDVAVRRVHRPILPQRIQPMTTAFRQRRAVRVTPGEAS